MRRVPAWAVHTASASSSDEALAVEGLSKSFGAIEANRRIDLTLRRGEVHGLLGENGSGKSTLVGLLTGRYTPDAGRIVRSGAALRGVAAVYQDLMLVPTMTGVENLAFALGLPPGRPARERFARAAGEYGLDVRLDTPIAALEVPEQQRLELLRALCQEPAVLLLDEPTSLLPPTVIANFLEQVRRLADTGLAVMLITHRLDEARSICDRVTVLRRGEVVARFERADLPSNRVIAETMVGSTVIEPRQMSRPSDDVVYRVSELSVAGDDGRTAVDDVSLSIHAGELLGIAGVDGNGQVELLDTIAGLRWPSVGSVELLGERLTEGDRRALKARGVEYVSGDRRRHGVVPTFSIAEHFEFALGRASCSRLDELIEVYGVQPPNAGIHVDRLSGGNQQKVMLARAFAQPAITVAALAYPTQGLDVQAAANVHQLLIAQADAGCAMAVASSELDELLLLCHRIVVLSRGRIVGEQHRASFDRSRLAEWMAQ